MILFVLRLAFCSAPADHSGVLACLDGYMNIAMEQTEEYVNGQLKAKYGDCFIRGNNGKLQPTNQTSPDFGFMLFYWVSNIDFSSRDLGMFYEIYCFKT